jgi:hypothetical protein
MRPDGPELILDGDMVVTAPPPWLDAWLAGGGPPRVAQDDRQDLIRPRRANNTMGRYADLADPRLKLYSGAVALPPRLRYMHLFRQARPGVAAAACARSPALLLRMLGP